MSTLTTSPTPASTYDRSQLRVTQGRVIASEWIKFRSLRSTYVTLLVIFVATVGIGVIGGIVTVTQWVHHMSASDRASFNPIQTSLNGVNFAELAIAVLGVLVISGEYATGMIRATMTIVPKRLPVLWAKMVVFGLVAAVVSAISTFAAFFVTQAILTRRHLNVSISSPGAFRMTADAFIYLTLVGIVALAIGTLIRNTAGSISTVVGLLYVLPVLFEILPHSWSSHVAKYTLSNAGQSFFGTGDPGSLSPAWSFVVLLVWTIVLVAAAAVRLKRTDA